jgi:diguanylate cyclase (GGDEF)-like protein
LNSNRLPLEADDSRLDVFFKFVSVCAWVRDYDALLQVLSRCSHRLAEFEHLSILLCDANRQISRIFVVEDHSAREIRNDEIQLSEMDLILQVLISGAESKSHTAMCIPMESADHMVGVLSLTAKDETHRDSETRFVYFLADCLARTFERLAKDSVWPGSIADAKSIPDARETTIAATHAVSLRMSYLAQHDALTDLPNRLLLGDRLARALALSKRYGRRLAVLFLDLDRFKPINDYLGHAVGDLLLRQISDRLVKCVRSSDTVGRLGGDEFVILLAELERTEDALVSANKIIAAVAEPMLIAGQEICLTISIGIGIYPDDGEDADALIQKADTAMYRAKAAGFGKCMFFGRHESSTLPPKELLLDTKEVTDV